MLSCSCGSRRRLRIDSKALGSHSTDLQVAKVLERANRLKRQLDAWFAVQLLYMPAVSQMRITDESDSLTSAVDAQLFLPSHIVNHTPVPYDLMEFEWRLRFAQAHDALHDIRRLLLVRSQMFAAKDRFSRGQRQVTRSQNLLRGVQSRIDASATKYREFRIALLRLGPPLGKVGWDDELQVLQEADVRGLSAKESSSSEGRVTMSWIWKVSDGGGNFNPAGPRMQEGMFFVQSIIIRADTAFQRFVSSGVNRVQEPIVGRKSVSCSRRKCEGLKSISLGRSNSGWSVP